MNRFEMIKFMQENRWMAFGGWPEEVKKLAYTIGEKNFVFWAGKHDNNTDWPTMIATFCNHQICRLLTCYRPPDPHPESAKLTTQEGIKFVKFSNGNKGLVMNNKQILFWDEDYKIWGIVSKKNMDRYGASEYRQNLPLIKCKNDDLKLGDWVIRYYGDQDGMNKLDVVNIKLVVSEKYVLSYASQPKHPLVLWNRVGCHWKVVF